MGMKRYRKKWIKMMALQMVMAGLLAGCGGAGVNNDNVVIVEQEDAPVEYKLVTAGIGDVLLTRLVSCEFTQLEAQELSFALSGKRVNKVYVKEGDSVNAGDVLAELSGADKREQIENLEYQIARKKMQAENIKTNEADTISLWWIQEFSRQAKDKYNWLLQFENLEDVNGLNYTGNSRAESIKKQVEQLQKSNEKTLEKLSDEIALDEKQLEALKKEEAQSYLRAVKSGTVSKIKERLEGSTSVKDDVVITILDNTECKFIVKDMSLLEYVSPDRELTMSIHSGGSAGTYKLIPSDMEHWDQVMSFDISQGDDNVVFEAGTRGYIDFYIDSREQVLCIPSLAVQSSDDGYYVYVVDDEGVRQVKWIEVGLIGNDRTEVTAGLTEGEKVVLR